MLIVRYARRQPTLQDWFVEHRLQLAMHALWAAGLTCTEALAQSDELAALFAAILEMR